MKNYIFTPKIKLLVFWSLLLCHFGMQAQLEDGYYTMKLASATSSQGFCDKNAENLGLKASDATSATQVWKIERDGAHYYIKLAGDGKAMDASYFQRNNNGCPVIFWDVNRGETQRWLLERQSDGNYLIKLALNLKRVTADYSPTTLTPNLYITSVVNTFNQKFTISKSSRVIRSSLFVDLRGNQTPYANQGPRGTCTYFASIAAMEAAYKKAGYGNVNLSEQYYSIFSKCFALHPIWADNTSANYRENQYALTQGGGSLRLLKTISIPRESVSPYSDTEDLGTYRWDDPSQRNCNSFNLNLIRTTLPSLADVSFYYGVSSCNDLTITEANLEWYLRNGYEIKICIYGGSHCVLLVGYDKTDPANKKLIIKNSYQPTGVACYEKLEYLPYSEIPAMVAAEYITAIKPVHRKTEMAAIGRWNLSFDGWKGQLDIYRLPGTNQYFLDQFASRNGGIITDNRLGTFYDAAGTAFRVNGSVTPIGTSAVKVVFYMDGSTPNLRWDALRGRRFEYVISLPNAEFMAGTHTDPDGRQYGGYAFKDPLSYYWTDAFTTTGTVTAFRSRSFLVRYKNKEYFGTFTGYNSVTSTVTGTFRPAIGSSIFISLKTYPGISNTYQLSIDAEGVAGTVITNSWDKGITAGYLTGASIASPICLIRRNVAPFTVSARTEEASDAAEEPLTDISSIEGTIRISDPGEGNKTVQIYNTEGRSVSSYTYQGSGDKVIPLELPNAAYIVVLQTDHTQFSKTIYFHK